MNVLNEPNIIICTCVSSLSGLPFVFSAGSDALFVLLDGKLKEVYIV